MRGDIGHDWDEVTSLLQARACLDPVGAVSARLPDGGSSGLRSVCMSALDASGGTWDDAVQGKVVEGMAAQRSSLMPNAGGLDDPHLPTALRCRRNAWLALNGRGDDIPWPERDMVRAALQASDGYGHLARGVGAALPYDDDATTGPVTVDFLHAYRQAGASGRGAKTLTATTSTVTIPTVDLADAPIVAFLKPVDGRAFPLRSVDGTLMRPVMAPGAWRPVGLDEFRDAAAQGWAWADNPFLPRPGRNDGVPAICDYACPPLPSHASDAARRQEAGSECARTAGAMCVIDGFVYRRTQEPTLHLAAREPTRAQAGDGPRRGFARVAWRLGDDVDMFTSMRADRVTAPEPVRDLLAGRCVRFPEPREVSAGRGRRGVVVRYGEQPTVDYAFGLGDAEVLSEVARTWVDLPRGRHVQVPRFRDDLACVGDLDPVRFPSSPTAAADALRAHAAARGGTWSGIPDPGLCEGRSDEEVRGTCEALRAFPDRFDLPRSVNIGSERFADLSDDGLDLVALDGARAMCEMAARALEATLTLDDEAVASLGL